MTTVLNVLFAFECVSLLSSVILFLFNVVTLFFFHRSPPSTGGRVKSYWVSAMRPDNWSMIFNSKINTFN